MMICAGDEGPDHPALSQLAKLYKDDGEEDKAAHMYRRLLELLDAQSPEAYASEVRVHCCLRLSLYTRRAAAATVAMAQPNQGVHCPNLGPV